jgi:hypothetical protein
MSDGPGIVIIDDMPGRRRLEPLAEEDRLALEQKRQAAVAAFAAEAEDRGWCTACWSYATDAGRFPRLARRTRHRRPQNCPRFLK